jgi:hypothetical protein
VTIALIRERVIRQPRGRLDIDRQHRLARGLAFAWSASSPQMAVEPRAIMITLGTSPGPKTGRGGVWWSTASDLAGSPANTSIGPITTSTGDGTGDYSVAVFAEPVAGATSKIMFMQYTDGTSNQIRFTANMTGGIVESSGHAAFIDYAGAFSGVGAAGVVDGLPHVYVGVRRGTTYELWVDGGLAASVTQTVRDVLAGTLRETRIGSDPAGVRPCGDPIYEVQAWNRALEPGEIPRRPADMWRLYRRSVPIAMPEAASGPTVAALTPTTIGSTSHRPRYTWTPA